MAPEPLYVSGSLKQPQAANAPTHAHTHSHRHVSLQHTHTPAPDDVLLARGGQCGVHTQVGGGDVGGH